MLANQNSDAGVIIGRVEIHEVTHPLRERGGKRGELIAGDRVTHECHPSEMQRIEHRTKISDPGREIIARGCLAGRPIPATGDGEHMVVIGEARSEVIEPVGHVLQSGKKDQWSARTAPVEYFQCHSRRDCDELRSVR